MSDIVECTLLQSHVLYRAARYIFQYADAIEQDFCLLDIKVRTCPYSTYREGEERDPDVCARCLIHHFEQQE